MSSIESDTASYGNSRIRDFGLYRTIDAKTEEFLRLSKRRQIRQGLACAFISTAITVAIVVIMLLVYEYIIMADPTLVQMYRPLYKRKNNGSHIINPLPVADRLDRSYFGIDQDYYEQMPLLINAMQEYNYIDPALESPLIAAKKNSNSKPRISKQISSSTADYSASSIRRTSPRPFIFEYRNPTPTPFVQSYETKNWLEGYRNAQRLKNLQQLVKYLEKTINARFGEMPKNSPSSKQSTISEIYVRPINEIVPNPKTKTRDLYSSNSRSFETIWEKSDPFFSYKPENLGDVNMLADNYFRFSPNFYTTLKKTSKTPMFRPITFRRKNCIGVLCKNKNESKSNESTEKYFRKNYFDTSKSLNVMLSLLTHSHKKEDNNKNKYTDSTPVNSDNIFITTSARPLFQFRRKSSVPIRRTIIRYKQPRLLEENKNRITLSPKNNRYSEGTDKTRNDKSVVLHVNVYPVKKVLGHESESLHEKRLFGDYNYSPGTQAPIVSSTQVEDYHIGSSGIIKSNQRKNFITSSPRSTINSPDIIKFSHEDAKIPYSYLDSVDAKQDNNYIRRSEVNEYFEIVDKAKDKQNPPDFVSISNNTQTKFINNDTSTSKIETYVPQINGHYRSKHLMNLENQEEDKNNVYFSNVLSVSINQDNIKTYKEIKRNTTNDYFNESIS